MLTCFDEVGLLIEKFALPVVVAVLAYIAVDRLGEWKRRRSMSILGVVVIDSLLEELRQGLRLMQRLAAAIDDPKASLDARWLLPHQSWDGMATISDDVMLRIIAVSKKGHFEGFQPRDMRSHCKNYFTHMTSNYQLALQNAHKVASSGGDWRPDIDVMLRSGEQPYIAAASGVISTLEAARVLLEKNSQRLWPR